MSFLPPELDAIAENFWRSITIDTQDEFPRDIERAISTWQDLWIEKLPNLTVQKVQSWCEKNSMVVPQTIIGEERDIFGCLVAHCGRGIIFVDETSTPAEKRFTTAHELSHYVRDYLQPRNSVVLRLGENILEVLDGSRLPSHDERIDAVLNGVHLGVYADLMLRGARNEFLNLNTSDIERNADCLSLELLAPYRRVLREANISYHKTPHAKILESTSVLLVSRFGLPSSIAAEYAMRLANAFGRRPTVRDWLGL